MLRENKYLVVAVLGHLLDLDIEDVSTLLVIGSDQKAFFHHSLFLIPVIFLLGDLITDGHACSRYSFLAIKSNLKYLKAV